MATKKEILDCVKSVADRQDLIATKQNTERKAEAITTQTLLAEIFRELQSIKNILEDAAKEPEKLKPAKQEQSDWVTGPEAAKLLGWTTCNARMLKGVGIAFRQDKKCARLSVSRPHIENYVARRNIKKNRG